MQGDRIRLPVIIPLIVAIGILLGAFLLSVWLAQRQELAVTRQMGWKQRGGLTTISCGKLRVSQDTATVPSGTVGFTLSVGDWPLGRTISRARGMASDRE